MYQELLKEWIKTISNKENRKYLKNSVELQVFAEWLDKRAAEQKRAADVCHECGTTYAVRALYCHVCGTRR